MKLPPELPIQERAHQAIEADAHQCNNRCKMAPAVTRDANGGIAARKKAMANLK